MRIGVFTFHRANNYGAVLQAAAFQRYIGKSHAECEIIDYYPNNAIPARFAALRSAAKCAVDTLRGRGGMEAFIKEKRFEGFRKRNLVLSHDKYLGDGAIKACPPRYDVLISGSDQILNTELTGCSRAFYLDFDTPAIKVSYASSFGKDVLNETERELTASALSRFERLSMREASGADAVEAILGARPPVVADPVLLLSPEEWRMTANKPKKLPERYVCVYAMEDSEALFRAAEAISRKLGVPAVTVKGSPRARVLGKELNGLGPAEFLGVISGAEYVVTNSFHGAAFALIFGRKLISAAHSKRNTRIENLLSEAGVHGRQLHENEELDEKTHVIEGAEHYKNLMPLIERSKAYIMDVLDPEKRRK